VDTKGYSGLYVDTQGYSGLHVDTQGYSGLRVDTQGYTVGYTWLPHPPLTIFYLIFCLKVVYSCCHLVTAVKHVTVVLGHLKYAPRYSFTQQMLLSLSGVNPDLWKGRSK